MRDLAWQGKAQLQSIAREAAHLVSDGKIEQARRIDVFAQYERGKRNDLFVNPVFAAAFEAALLEG